MIVRSYRTCDICGKKLSNDIEEFNYRNDPYSSSFWTEGLDICKDCWEDMKEWIKENENKKS